MPSDVETTFHNVTITIIGEPKEAYKKLCAALGTIDGVEWQTESYSTHSEEGGFSEVQDTSELFETEPVKS